MGTEKKKKLITLEKKNHRMVWGERDLQDHLVPTWETVPLKLGYLI